MALSNMPDFPWKHFNQPDKLSDLPAQTKTNFDSRGTHIRDWVNGTLNAEVNAHTANVANPHSVTSEQINFIGALNADATPAAYPDGISVLETGSTQTGWQPITGGNNNTVFTVIRANDRMFQFIVHRNFGNIFLRPGNVDGTAWGTPVELSNKADLDTHTASKAPHPNIPAARAYNSNVSILSSSITTLAFNSEDFDTDNIHSTVTNTTRLTCNTAGIYQITARAGFNANANGYRTIRIRINGSGILVSQNSHAVSSLFTTDLGVTTLESLVVGNYIEMEAYQNSGGDLTVFAQSFMMVRVG